MTTLPPTVKSGDSFRFPADFYNTLIEMAAAFRANRPGSSADGDAPGHRPFNLVYVKNGSGADRAMLDVMTVSSSVLTSAGDSDGFKRDVVLSGAAVSTTLTLAFVVCAEPIKSNQFGWAYCSGIFPARINIGSSSHTHAGLKASDSTQLDSAFAGNAKIIYKESGTGTKLAVVEYPVVPIGATTSPTTLGGSTEGSETAASDTWTRATSGTPLEEWYISRVGYWHAGDGKLYAFYRKRTYDSCGLLISVSAETRVEIDAPEACP